MPGNIKGANASTAVGSQELMEYRAAKRVYHEAGSSAKGTPPGSMERQRYEVARAAYQEAGRKLRASRAR